MRSFSIVLFAVLIASAVPAFSAGRVQLELVGDQQAGAAMGFQQWLQTLARAGVQNVRMRVADANVKLGIEVRGTEQNPVYVVTGMINSRDELVVPGGRFRRGDVAGIKEWAADLSANGPLERREAKGPFGMTEKQFEKIKEDLAQPAAFSIKDMTRSEAVEKIKRQLALPLGGEGELAGGDEKIEEELSGLACGTVLAAVLRPAGYAMVPQEADGKLSYTISKTSLDKLGREVWPIGWKPGKSLPEALPALFEFRNVNVQDASAKQVLDAISRQISVPILLDHNALARHGIEPEKAVVEHPQARTNYSVSLKRMLFKAGMKFELRVDEAGKAFLWVTSLKPV